jgi:hypothetical protein
MLTAAGLLLAGAARADDSRGSDLKRLSAEFQNSSTGANEISTTAAALPNGAGATPVYQKNLRVSDDVDVLYVTFSAQSKCPQRIGIADECHRRRNIV